MMSLHLLLRNGWNKFQMNFITSSESETILAGYQFGKELKENSVICFFGDLGAGKTTFIKGIVSAFGGDPHEVTSPTFVYLNIYKGQRTIYHFDLYRLKKADEFLSMGFDELFFSGGICCIEWSERIEPFLPQHIRIDISHLEEKMREIKITL